MDEEIRGVILVGWFIAWGVLGVAYLIVWVVASSHCKNKWVMLTPFWVLMRNSFNEDGVRTCRTGLTITLLIIGGYALYRIVNVI